MTVSDVRTKLKARLETITELTVHGEVPLALGKFPAAVIDVEALDYHRTMGASGGAVDIEIRVFLLVAEGDAPEARSTLDGYMAPSGTTSMLAAIEGTSGGAPAVADYAFLRRVENIGYVSYRGQTYYGAEFVVEVAN